MSESRSEAGDACKGQGLSTRAALRQAYGTLFDRIAAILFEADPVGINFGTNTDEYEPEAATILPRLCEAGSARQVERIVHEEFCRWFDAEDVGPPQNYRVAAEAIWREWCASLGREAR